MEWNWTRNSWEYLVYLAFNSSPSQNS
jgi:hypothetical protein